MFGWAVTFLIIAIIAGVFGFAGIASPATAIAKVLCFVGLAVFFGLLAAGRKSAPPSRPPQARQGTHTSRSHPV